MFGGDSGISQEKLDRQRKVAEQLLKGAGGTPRNTGEGISAIGNALLYRSLQNRIGRGEAELAKPQKASIPAFRLGTNHAPGGLALVGEEGPELVDLPKGAKVAPNPETDGGAEIVRMLLAEYAKGATPSQNAPQDPFMAKLNEAVGREPGGGRDEEAFSHMGEQMMTLPPRERYGFIEDAQQNRDRIDEIQNQFLQEDSRFDDANAYQVADLGGISPETMGASTEGGIQKEAFAYAALLRGLDDYEAMLREGTTMWPGERKDRLDAARTNLQMQMKEIYGLGALQGPDKQLLDDVFLNPTSISGNIMDSVGFADIEDRALSNLSEVRTMMRDLIEPKLQAANIDINALAPPSQGISEMTDEQLLQMLQGN